MLPLFVGFFGVMALGYALQRRLHAPLTAAAVARSLTTIIVDVTAPALTLDVLLRARIAPSLFVALAPPTGALLVTLAAVLVACRAARLDAAQTGALALTLSFSNTGFIGIPLIQGLFSDPRAAQSAVLIDSIDTTLLLWTLGVAVAAQHGAGRRGGASLGSLLRKPVTWAVIVGFALNAAGVTLPAWLRPGVERLGAATGPLVFLALGLGVDLSKLRGRLGVLAAAVVARLALSPLVALAVALVLGLRGVEIEAAVLQAAMPTALVSVVIATEEGCDGALASAVATATMALSPFTLPLWSSALRRALA